MSMRRILIVDDDSTVRMLLRTTLREDLYEVVEAGTADEALRLVDGDVPDLILLDWAMPTLPGAEVLEAVKTRHPEVPVIVLTAELGAVPRSEANALGADAFLTKPFSPLELLDSIERLLPERPLNQPS